MKFKTRLLITFFTIILLPLTLAVTAFLAIGNYLLKEQEEYGFRNSDYNVLIDPTQASRVMSDEIFFEVKDAWLMIPTPWRMRRCLRVLMTG